MPRCWTRSREFPEAGLDHMVCVCGGAYWWGSGGIITSGCVFSLIPTLISSSLSTCSRIDNPCSFLPPSSTLKGGKTFTWLVLLCNGIPLSPSLPHENETMHLLLLHTGNASCPQCPISALLADHLVSCSLVFQISQVWARCHSMCWAPENT